MLSLLFATIAIAQCAASFTSADLKHALATDCKGPKKCVFYMWSPNMPLSIQGLPEAIAFARQSQIHLVTLVDDQSDPALATRVAAERKLPKSALVRLGVEEFFALGARIHFPSYVFATGGKLSSPLVPGYRDRNTLPRVAQSFLK